MIKQQENKEILNIVKEKLDELQKVLQEKYEWAKNGRLVLPDFGKVKESEYEKVLRNFLDWIEEQIEIYRRMK